MQPPVRVCFVCSGNICRSPTAEVVLARLARDRGVDGLIEVDSAGTGSWHAGDDMDERARAALVDAGYDVPVHVARQFAPEDFADRDVIVALDTGHWNALWRLAGRTPDPEAARAKLVLLRTLDPELVADEDPDVADPYYGGPEGFTNVLEQVERSCVRLLDRIEQQLAQQTESPPR